jgi:outer membrane protein assembly factor BamB
MLPSGRLARPRVPSFLSLCLALTVVAACMGRLSGSGADAGKDAEKDAAASLGPTAVLTGHMHPSRDGTVVDKAMTHKSAAALKLVPGFDATFEGAVFGQPLFVDGLQSGHDAVFVATDTNTVYALDAGTGRTLWHTTLGTPVSPSYLPCHQPIAQSYGIISTPVIDPGSRTLFTEAFVLGGDGGTTPRHLVYGLSIDDGSIRSGWPVDVVASVDGFFASSQHQRGSLLLLGGTLYLPFSSCGADCEPPPYHGWVVGISISDPTQVTSWHTAANRGGIWGALASDGTNIFFSTGNTYQLGDDPAPGVWGGGEAVFRLGPDLTFTGDTTAYFTPSNWRTLDESDVDLGSASVVLLDVPGAKPSSLVVAMGKQGTVYLEDTTNLGGLGQGDGETGEGLFSALVDMGGTFGNPATYVTTKGRYIVTHAVGNGLDCPNGTSGNLIALKVAATSPPTFSTAWCAVATGLGSPMVTTIDGQSDPIVWLTTSQGSNVLLGFDGDTGASVFTGGGVTMAQIIRWSNPIVAEGRLYVAATGKLYAFEP